MMMWTLAGKEAGNGDSLWLFRGECVVEQPCQAGEKPEPIAI